MIDKLKFWTPLFGGFFVVPGQKNYLDGDFFKKQWMIIPFMIWHILWLLGMLYLLTLIH